MRWDLSKLSGPVRYFIDSSAADDADVIRQAFADWQAVDGAAISFTEVSVGSEAQIQVQYGGGKNPFAGGEAELTYAADSREIVYCVALTDEKNPGKGLYLHEIGHCLGLAHSVSNGAVMSYRSKGELTADDSYALILLYPEGDIQYPAGCGSVRGPSEPDFGLVLLLSAVVLQAFRRRVFQRGRVLDSGRSPPDDIGMRHGPVCRKGGTCEGYLPISC